MNKNMGRIDQIFRIIIGVLFSLVVLLNQWNQFYHLISVVLIVTSVLNFCPLYRLVGIKTCKIGNKKA